MTQKLSEKKIYHLETIDSTNFYAKNLAEDNAEEGTIVVADVQSSGRGRKDRVWSSPKGGLWFSVVLYPNISPESGMLVTMASSIAVAEGIKETTGLSPIIKWPNDILINGKKTCGILTEIEPGRDSINHAIVGIGINVNNQLEKELQLTATTLRQELGAQVAIDKLLRTILKKLDKNYHTLRSGNFKLIRGTWLSYSNIIGKRVQVQDDEAVAIGKVTDIDKDGCLILDTAEGLVKIVSGDVIYF